MYRAENEPNVAVFKKALQEAGVDQFTHASGANVNVSELAAKVHEDYLQAHEEKKGRQGLEL